MLSNKKSIWYILILVTILDLLIPFILAPFYKGYSHNKMVMSVLGNTNSSIHIIYNFWLVLLGIALSICAIQIFISFKSESLYLSLFIAVILFIFAIGACILSGIFPVGETKQMITISSKIHGFGATIGFSFMVFIPLLSALLMYKSQDRVGLFICIASFIFAIIAFTLFIMADKEEFSNSFINNEGLWQRLALLFMYLPLDYLAIIKIISK